MSRIEKARQAFLKGSLTELYASHQKKTIHQVIHQEVHSKNFNLPEVILGFQDGLVNVLGIVLGMAAATVSSKIVIIAGLAATFAESVAMAAVAYTSTLAEADYYQSELEREKWEIEKYPQGEKEELRAMYENYGFRGKILNDIVEKIASNKDNWLKVMMEQELKLEKVDRKEALPKALTVGISSFCGSLVPVFPFFIFAVKQGVIVSLTVSFISLFILGYIKAKQTLGRNLLKNGLEIAIIGMTSAAIGYLIGSILKV